MIDLLSGRMSVREALDAYEAAWKAFLVVHHLESLKQIARPTTLSWKVATKTELFANLEAIARLTEQVHIGTVNNRFIASVVLHEPLENGLAIIKILERRTGSNDALGLDSIDYLVDDTDHVLALLRAAQAQVAAEHNEVHDWLSLRFGESNQFEAKFTDHLVIDVAIKELKLAKKRLL